MEDYNYDDYVYFNNIIDTQNEHHNNFILNQIPDFHITSPFKSMDDVFEPLPELFVDRIKKNMKSRVQIVAQLSKVNLWNKENKKKELMYNTREKMMNTLSRVDFAKLCHVIKYFTQSNQVFGKEEIISPLSSSSTAIEWRKIYLIEFETGLSIFNTRTYHDFKIYKKICGDHIFTRGNEMRDTCAQSFLGQYKQLSTILIPLCL